MENQHTVNETPAVSTTPYLRTAIIWITTLIILAFAGKMGEYSSISLGVSSTIRHFIQAIIMSGLLIPVIWYLTSRYDQSLMEHVGFQKFKPSFLWFLLGAGLILTPMFLTLTATHIFGWGTIEFNDSVAIFSTLVTGLITVFLFEALPEEMAFRGYIFSQIDTKHKTWIAGIISVILFALLPITLFGIQSLIFTSEVNFGSQNTLSGSYVMTMLFFGGIVQYLRIITKTIWTGVGFHLAFVYSDRLVGVTDTDLIIIADATNQTAPQLMLLSLMGLVIITFIIVTYRQKKKLTTSMVF